MKRMMIGASAALAVAFGTSADGFEFLGLRSGMTRAEVQAAAPAGYELRIAPAGWGAIIRGDDIFATVAFCHDRLVSVVRMIDPDADWFPAVEKALRERGAPHVLAEAQPWSGPAGGDVHSFKLRWTDPRSQFELSISSEERDGAGALRHNRSASESFLQTTGNACFTGS